MAIAVQDFSQILTRLKPTFDPQNFSSTGAGRAIQVGDVGTNIITAELFLGDANTFTSLVVKFQAATDDGTGNPDAATWVDITGLDGSVVAFATVTTDPGTDGVVPEMVSFKLPPALTISSKPYIWVRGFATLVGTSIYMCVNLLATRKFDQQNAYNNAPGNNGNNVIN